MIGLIAGDIIGSLYEGRKAKDRDFPLFHPQSRWTDDSVLALAVAEAILTERPYGEVIHQIGNRYPHAGYGGSFMNWLMTKDYKPYNSWGNGSGMRVAAVGYAFDSIESVMEQAKASAEVTHNHPEGIKGAQAIALSVFLARCGAGKEEIRRTITGFFNYDLNRTVNQIQKYYSFDVSCQGSVPEAIISFLDAESYEETIRNAVFLGGDSDTIGAMAGAIAEAYYKGVPNEITVRAVLKLPRDLLDIMDRFRQNYIRFANDDSIRVKGPLETKFQTIDYVKQTFDHDTTFPDSDYFKKNVGYLKKENLDTSSMKKVDVEDVKDDDDIESSDLTESFNLSLEEMREHMKKDNQWFHDNGMEVIGDKHLIVSANHRAVTHYEYLIKEYAIEACIPEYLVFFDVFNAYSSMNYFIETADTIHVFLSDFTPDEIEKATVRSDKAANTKEELKVRHKSLWMINRVYWLKDKANIFWYAGSLEEIPFQIESDHFARLK